MAESPATPINMQQIKQCRRLARRIFDQQTADRLFAMANEIEQRAREVDLEWDRNESQGNRLA